MSFKKHILIFVVLIVLIAISAFLGPVNAFNIHKSDNSMVYYSNGKSVIATAIYSKFGSDYDMAKDLNKIDKIAVKVNKRLFNV